MKPISRWKPGDPIVFRGVWRQKLWWALPVTVVQDSPNLIALYWRAGNPDKIPREKLTPQELLSIEKPDLVDKVWKETDVLMLYTPGAAHAVYVMWETGHTEIRCWYIDLQNPLHRTSIGFNTRDHVFDAVISSDRSEWWWKDEDEFAEAVAIGLFSTEEARAIRTEGERVIELVRADQPPFCDGWEMWRPPTEWGIPDFPANWDNIAEHDDAKPIG
ncbi:MAG: DUF402 domain-containing protein [Chloroflexi bacterium]|nr:DUF402 domain-containing protein [Chloroflexota bacterium]